MAFSKTVELAEAEILWKVKGTSGSSLLLYCKAARSNGISRNSRVLLRIDHLTLTSLRITFRNSNRIKTKQSLFSL